MKQRTLETLYGLMHVPDWSDDLILRSLRQLGEWCAAEAILAGALLEPGDTLWDAGAFLGTFALGVARQTTPGQVVAIEANPDVTGALERNLGLLPCPARLAPCGVGARGGWLGPALEDPQNHGATRYSHAETRPEEGPAIPCRTLADLRAEFGPYDMLKLDLEGMELDALRGDLWYLRDRHPLIWAECNESPESLSLLGGLKWLEYDVLYVAFPAFRKTNHRGTEELIYPMAYEAALVAGPAERLAGLATRAAALVPGEDIICRPIATSFDLRRALFDTPRWARPDWTGLSRAELIARLGRMEKGVALREFLKDN
ncbi:FkbM family methyltransferase [Paracoccus sp. S-4012]|uniref:FkbM family methyltransferase n=1 Tax=Paracoccus sp. S-4012 TaxID=2665648 RepID=UPI0018A1D075